SEPYPILSTRETARTEATTRAADTQDRGTRTRASSAAGRGRDARNVPTRTQRGVSATPAIRWCAPVSRSAPIPSRKSATSPAAVSTRKRVSPAATPVRRLRRESPNVRKRASGRAAAQRYQPPVPPESRKYE